jgi:PAT family beta-lactamase induction signal transducer AmpG
LTRAVKEAMAEEKKKGRPWFETTWVSTFTRIGLREAVIGLTNLYGLGWNFKFLWAPFVDIFGTRRGWLLKMQGALVVGFLLVSLLTLFGPPVQQVDRETGEVTLLESPLKTSVNTRVMSLLGRDEIDPETITWVVAGLFFVLAFVAATHDIAIDGYYLEALPDKDLQASYSGFRSSAWRVAIPYARSFLVWIAGVSFWAMGFLVGALTLLALFFFHYYFLPRPESDVARRIKGTRDFFRTLARAFVIYLKQRKVWIIIPFIILYKLPDEVMFSMNTTFLIRELRMTDKQYAYLFTWFGFAATVIGAIWAGKMIKRYDLFRVIWPLTLIMNLSNVLYVFLAWFRPTADSGAAALAIVTAVATYEQLAASVGYPVLMVFIMRTCFPEFKASHFAIGTAIMTIGGTLFGATGGAIVEAGAAIQRGIPNPITGTKGEILEAVIHPLVTAFSGFMDLLGFGDPTWAADSKATGYVALYLISIILIIPSLALIPFIPYKHREEQAGTAADTPSETSREEE